MNCRRFQNRLYEYVEGTLSASVLDAAHRHLAQCRVCREAVRTEKEFAQRLSKHLRENAESLTLRPEIRQQLRVVARRQPAPLTGLCQNHRSYFCTIPKLVEVSVGWWKRFAWPTATALLLLLIITFFSTHIPSVRGPAPAPGRPVEPNLPPAVTIQLSARVPTHEFRREGNWVIDTFAYETVVASETVNVGGRKDLP